MSRVLGGVCESCGFVPATAFVFFEAEDSMPEAGFRVCDSCIPVEITAVSYA